MKLNKINAYIIILALSVLGLRFHAQPISKLAGAHSNGATQVFSTINLSGNAYSQLSVIAPRNPVAGESTFDEINARYFTKTASTIFVINAISGSVMDSIPNVGAFHNMEYDKGSNSLVGMCPTGTTVVFKSYNLITKAGVTKSTLISVDSTVLGESTFDPINRRYFSNTNLGVVVIDSNGILVDVLCSSPYLKGLEYHPGTNRVYYLEWNGNNFDFVSVEANTCSLGFIGSLISHTSTANGESTFDRALGRYYCKTNMGIVEIDVQNGSVLQTFQATNNFAGMEFMSLTPAGLFKSNSQENLKVFPNPSTGSFSFSELNVGTQLEIFDSEGRSVFQTTVKEKSLRVDFEEKNKGLYFYTIRDAGTEIHKGKLILR